MTRRQPRRLRRHAWWTLGALVIVCAAVLALTLQRALARMALSAEFPPPAPAMLEPDQEGGAAPDFDPTAATGPTPVLAYRARAAALRQEALRAGKVTYADAVLAAYGRDVITPRVLAIKAHYRKRLPRNHRFVTDYGDLQKVSIVCEGVSAYDPLTRTTLRGLFDSSDDRIILTKASPDTVLFHEAAHGLQVKASTMADLLGDRRTYVALKEGRLNDSEERWLRYATSRKELEISLQDLNRCHALATQRGPITRPEETISTLARLTVFLESDEIAGAYAREKRPITLAQIETMRASASREPWASLLFPDAARLKAIRTLALRAERAYWIELLNQIIFEAPGHL